MELRPILSAMLRNKTGAILVGLQIALTLAVVANAVFIIMQRVEKIGRPSGIDSENLIFVQSFGFGPTLRSSRDRAARPRRDSRDARRDGRDVDQRHPAIGRRIPLLFRTNPDVDVNTGIDGNTYELDEHGVAALGVRLAEGRAFTEAEIQYTDNPTSSDFVPSAIITSEMARSLYGGRTPHWASECTIRSANRRSSSE